MIARFGIKPLIPYPGGLCLIERGLFGRSRATLCSFRDIYDMCVAMITKLATVASFAAIGLASPIPDLIDLPLCVHARDVWSVACTYPRHDLYCDNLPGVRAGTAASQARKKPRDQSEPIQNISHILQPPTTYQNGTYCEPQTEVFVVFGLDAVNPGVSSYLSACLSAVQEAINTGKTGPIPDGGWRGPLGHNALSMVVWSEDTYQTTWLELYLAIQALIGWMSSEGHTFGTGGFQIWDGEHKVGHGSIARAAAIRRMSPYILQRALDSQVHSPTVPEV